MPGIWFSCWPNIPRQKLKIAPAAGLRSLYAADSDAMSGFATVSGDSSHSAQTCVPTTASEQNDSVLRLLDHLNKGETGLVDQEAVTDVTTFLDLCEHHPALRGASMYRQSSHARTAAGVRRSGGRGVAFPCPTASLSARKSRMPRQGQRP